VALYLAADEPLLARPGPAVEGPVAAAIRTVLKERGATFFADIARAVGGFPNDIIEVLWRMVWAGEVTNDTLEPLRSRADGTSPASGRGRHLKHAAPEARGPHPRLAQYTRAPRTGPAGSEGRWSLRSRPGSGEAGDLPSRGGGAVPTDTEQRTALARALLARYGVVMRETAHAEGVTGGFAAIYEILKAMEDQGRVRRGYFVEGRGGAQFALPGADERLRAYRETTDADGAPLLLLAATDPANAWGALVDWPSSEHGDARPQRAAGAVVVLDEGALLGWMGRGEHPVLTFLPAGEPQRSRSARRLALALGSLADRPERRALLVSTLDGVPAARSPLASYFLEAGFSPSAQGLLRRKSKKSDDHEDADVEETR
jgi:ATP-dependent Lhr-like helicase